MAALPSGRGGGANENAQDGNCSDASDISESRYPLGNTYTSDAATLRCSAKIIQIEQRKDDEDSDARADPEAAVKVVRYDDVSEDGSTFRCT